ncbi:hypothetical protein A2797_02505 [candidate division WWE3 bacterium RIFCSPHIGHO2_01_FULL_48_15]|uniref:Ribosomal protein n=1 Tax=candidate division WWE3 bacterium RIFCSPHIGHO2_01_FULL_48_15 TaxID=1802619 RepID=A0A1F4VFS8_UNCKA|nr:MAG: hypothetical protein A2797_02505 [candidate division WWE3 bacterium RIFCSPHIGHO2_01_FULL_48_15]
MDKQLAEKPKAVRSKVKKVRGKKYVAASGKRGTEELTLEEAVKKAKELSYAKFDASLDAHITLELEKADQQIRAFTVLPHGTGKELRVLVFSRDADEAKIEEISAGGAIPYDAVVATPAFMSKLAKVARILGPKGLMPTPKTGTVTDDPEKVVEELKKGRVEIKTEVKPVIHVSIGRVSFPDEHLVANFKAVVAELKKQSKIKSVILAPTMGPSVKVRLDSL